jgi:hypothetical protein
MGDLFERPYFPVRHAHAVPGFDLSLRVKTALGRALKECQKSAAVIAAEMSEMLPPEHGISADALYTYTAPSKAEHQISLIRFKAFVRATGAKWLWDFLVEDEGLVVVEGREAQLAELGAAKQELMQLEARVKGLCRELARAPVPLKRAKR